jgi:N-methylhydantoinase A
MRIVGVDIGGTFTDVILSDTAAGRTFTHKVPTTAEDPSHGMIRGIREVCSAASIPPDSIEHVFHGTTIATNAILEYDGAKTGMITTEGYRDIIHIGRHQRPQHYSIMQDIPWQARPLVQRRHRKVVSERLVPPVGDVLVPLDEDKVRAAVAELKAAGVESIAVCFLFSYLNPRHEDRVREIIQEMYPEAFVSTSAAIFPLFREFERFTTACINAFVGPKVRRYTQSLASSLSQSEVAGELHLMRSNGGVATAQSAADAPVTLLLSGPAAGVLGGLWAGSLSGRENLITFDAGGTSADIGIVTPRGIVEASARDTFIAGYPVMVPMIDVHSIGAGGGSIAYVDRGGAFRVGPRSAGSQPGPACYGKGGDQPTVTDANIVLKRLDAEHFLGGEMQVFPELAEQAIRRLAEQLGMDLFEAAHGVVEILNSNMANAIRSRTIQKGFDPRTFSLVAFGGAGPLHAAEVADTLEIPEIVVPAFPGITSATGLLTTDLKYDTIHTEFMLSTDLDLERLNGDMRRIEERVRSQLRRDRMPDEKIRLSRWADCRYVGQGYELRVEVPDGELDAAGMERVWQRFHDIHAGEYGHAFPSTPIEVVTIRIVGVGEMVRVEALNQSHGTSLESALIRHADAYFRTAGGDLSTHTTAYYHRGRLPLQAPFDGPAVIFQKDSTTVVPPDWRAVVDKAGNLILSRKDAAAGSRLDGERMMRNGH